MSEDIKGPRVRRAVSHDATDRKHGMTLDEMAAFVQEAMRQEIPGETIVKATATWKQSVKRLEISG